MDYKDESVWLMQGDCLERMKELEDNSVDSIVTDPPYGISFMNKKWDHQVPSVEIWKECLRVLKPGGYLLSFAGTRTQHRMACNIEDAGFEIRDMIAWVYAQGMPKHKSCLKPALEPITLARKPAKKATLLNIDECRVELAGSNDAAQFENNHRVTERLPESYQGKNIGLFDGGWKQKVGEAVIPLGRYPANLVHDGSEDVRKCFPDSNGQQGDLIGHSKERESDNGCYGKFPPAKDHAKRIETDLNASRFFFCAKTTKKDRGEGNNHATVKPTELMRYLCRLITPKDGIVLDPFMGSGSTGKAAVLEGFNFIGIEMDEGYLRICKERILKDD